MSQNLLVFPARLATPPDTIYAGDGEFRENRLHWLQPLNLWTAIYYHHSNVVTINARTFAVAKDQIVIFAPGVRASHAKIDGETTHQYLAFILPATEGKRSAIPALVTNGLEIEPFFRNAIARVSNNHTQACAFAWQLMHYVALDPAYLRQNEALYSAEEFIVTNLRSELRVPEIAEFAQVSPRQLLRMFRDEHHLTVQDFIRKKRTQEACRLLATTARPIKLIAEQVGVPDLAQFNKLLKRETGAPPRTYRQMRSKN